MKAAVFGSFVVDLMARSPHLPAPGETVRGSMFKMGPGGKGFNQGVAAHKAGADIAMFTKLGRDTFANVALDAMADIGLSNEHIFYSDDVPTGTALILVDEHSAQNEIIVIPGACATVTAREVESIRHTLSECDYVLLQLEVNQDANEAVAKMAREYGTKVILNTAPYSPVSDEFLSMCHMVTPNEVEAEAMTGIPVTDLGSAKLAADYFHKKGVEAVVITLGSRGVFVSAEGMCEMIPAYKVNAIDTTGAGDAFNGGLLTALLEGKPLREAARFANALAALSVQKLGTTLSMPTRAEIDAFLAEH